MANVDGATFLTQDPGIYKQHYIGTVAGTTTISKTPCMLAYIVPLQRVASGQLTWYDSDGTSASVLGTFAFGTQPGYDPGAPIMIKHNTNTALTVVNTANVGALVLYL